VLAGLPLTSMAWSVKVEKYLSDVLDDHGLGFDGRESKEAPVVDGRLFERELLLSGLQLTKLPSILRANGGWDVEVLQTIG
jgi:hypothetical protein